MTSPAHPRVATVARLLTEAGGTGEVRVLPAEVRTAAAAAAALDVPVGAIVNSLVFDVGGAPVLILTSGAHRVDESKVAALLGVPSRDPGADADFVRRHTGQAIGGRRPDRPPRADRHARRRRARALRRRLGRRRAPAPRSSPPPTRSCSG